MEPVSILAWLFVAAGVSIASIGKRNKSPEILTKRKRSTDMSKIPTGFEPISHQEVVARAELQRGSGTYHLGGGAHFSAPSLYSKAHNRFPGQGDCTGLLAYSGKYRRGRWNTDAIVDDAKGDNERFRLVRLDEAIRPGDFIVTGRGYGKSDHAGIVHTILPGFVRLGPEWWKKLLVIHTSGRGQLTIDPLTGKVFGATRITDARTWKTTGSIIRPLHVY